MPDEMAGPTPAMIRNCERNYNCPHGQGLQRARQIRANNHKRLEWFTG